MEPKVSSPHSQVPDTCPYPEPYRSSPYTISHFLKIRLNIILPSTPRSPKWSLSLTFPHHIPVYASLLPHTSYMPRPSHSSRIYHPKNIGWAAQIIKLLIMQFSLLPCYNVPLRPKYSLSTLFSYTLSLRSSLSVNDQVSHPYKTKGKIIILYTLIFKFSC